MADAKAGSERPPWRRIVDYPLVTMLIAIAIYAMAATLSVRLGRFMPPVGPTANVAIQSGLTILFLLAAYLFLIARLGERPKSDLPPGPAVRDTAVGIGLGFALMAAAVGVAALLGIYRIVGSGDASRLVFALIATAIYPAVTEELLFRGILFRWIEEFGGSWLALAVTALLFGLAHIGNPNATWFSSFAIAIEAGILLGAAYMLTRSLWLAMGLHGAWNFTQGELFDVPVSGVDEHGLVQAQLSGPELLSGGAFGLEASIITLTIATAVGVWMLVRAIRDGRLIRPHWRRKREDGDPLAEIFG